MKPNYQVHESMYVDARQAGWEGWGGNERMSKAVLVERFLDLCDRPKQGKLLELGCGEGHHCRAFQKLGFEVTGIDISPTAIAWAKEKAKATGIEGKYYTADLTVESFQLPERYDVVIDGNCLHCIIGADRAIFLDHVYRNLSESGVFFVSSLCSKDETYRDSSPYRHIASQSGLVIELEQAGFQVLNVRVYERDTSNHITVYAIKA
ncbi:class I SAM-dependent methyltransferase [Vibrio parahaemolyticus]|uniref:class I SAM-dependent methyltransferase n=1 Tax=Vibrio parahaemolyticus TaxID=670 RepID=UPI0023ED8E23|nr:class I SAM-dependent methyltransferase [Vibrio parahaemolyticus]MDF4344323.1 class I SAM-dependent methyltransferase [Vibrio parahaemolyticus]MDF4359078.1 class I SAM-dependent methyltransferase [Vibrio parahaemolyticus]MDF4418543.1 class I SAM-dependent methyltransferase [Vibrio parahaemolyticus]MDF4526321.1 class I SAM-dependent methyltransferase [Vibrio parahaemolyticus]MDF4553315.1 class I SAM-dependent methyltransferase [Vibrio parahaemolyticus]